MMIVTLQSSNLMNTVPGNCQHQQIRGKLYVVHDSYAQRMNLCENSAKSEEVYLNQFNVAKTNCLDHIIAPTLIEDQLFVPYHLSYLNQKLIVRTISLLLL